MKSRRDEYRLNLRDVGLVEMGCKERKSRRVPVSGETSGGVSLEGRVGDGLRRRNVKCSATRTWLPCFLLMRCSCWGRYVR